MLHVHEKKIQEKVKDTKTKEVVFALKLAMQKN